MDTSVVIQRLGNYPDKYLRNILNRKVETVLWNIGFFSYDWFVRPELCMLLR
jgi:hypothetical protein